MWIETPSNPLLRITDLRFVIDAAHKAGAIAVVDNTFLSPALQTPITDFGADVVVHSTTKYINGHSDVVGGAVIAATQELHERFTWWANALGITGAPFDSFLTLRGLRTLDARLRVHQENATAIAEQLDAHPAVSQVYFPGLASHPGHALAARQQKGFGAMLSVELDGDEDCRARLRRWPALLHPGRIARRRGKPDRAPGDDDPRGDDARGARRSRHLRRPAAAVGRHRGAGGPAGRSGRRAGARAVRDRGRGAAAGRRMNVALGSIALSPARPKTPRAVQAAPRLALLGTGHVGAAFVARCQALRARGVPVPAFAWLSNSRALADGDETPADALRRLRAAPVREGAWAPWVEAESLRRGDIVVDATASDSVAGWHSEWLARGIHVVTANKLGNGADLARAQAIADARCEHDAHYGDSATVGAGLPLLRSLRELVAGGDRIRSVEGVLSGSLAWLFDRYDGMRPFSGLVRAARDAGYTEPDPRIDLSGEDVRRKLLILARAAGLPLRAEQVEVASLVPDVLAQAPAEATDVLLPSLDGPLRERYLQADRDGARLRFVGRFEIDETGAAHADVGLRALPRDHALCGGRGTDNRIAIRSCRYDLQPLVIQGPGAGAEVTAAALLDDVLRIASRPLDDAGQVVA